MATKATVRTGIYAITEFHTKKPKEEYSNDTQMGRPSTIENGKYKRLGMDEPKMEGFRGLLNWYINEVRKKEGKQSKRFLRRGSIKSKTALGEVVDKTHSKINLPDS
jgi:hypothetical protein